MWTLGIYTSHDAGAALFRGYDMVAAVAEERVSRVKSDGFRFPAGAVAECLACAGITADQIARIALPRCAYPHRYYTSHWRDVLGRSEQTELITLMGQRGVDNSEQILDVSAYLKDHGLPAALPRFFYNHHFAHALGALFHMPRQDALLWTADGSGDLVYYSAHLLRDGTLKTLFGGDEESLSSRRPQGKSSLGYLYMLVTQALGFIPMRHEGKVLGLAAWGDPRHADRLIENFSVDDQGRISGRRSLKPVVRQMVQELKREDMAAAVQHTLETVMLEAAQKLYQRHTFRSLGLSGGVFANVRLTQKLAQVLPVEEVFVYPAMSDQGLAAGGVLQALLARDGLGHWLDQRQRFTTLYYGHDYEADAVFQAAQCHDNAQGNVVQAVARFIAEGGIIGTYLGRMEYGPRALGARSIMASAVDRTINETLNARLSRTEFMPFAPVVRAERVADVFDLPDSLGYTAQFMTTTCDVRPQWREKIPAVVHVDGTARPQIIHRHQNPVYYDILETYEQMTGLPVLINTSFNVHEEPIINRPEEALRALQDGRIDAVVTGQGMWSRVFVG